MTFHCQRCGTEAGTLTSPLFGMPREPKVCRGCWYATHDNYPADGRQVPDDPLDQVPPSAPSPWENEP